MQKQYGEGGDHTVDMNLYTAKRAPPWCVGGNEEVSKRDDYKESTGTTVEIRSLLPYLPASRLSSTLFFSAFSILSKQVLD